MANFGIGLGAFTNGLARGIGLRKQIDVNKRERAAQKREDERQQAYTEARASYDSAIGDDVLSQAGQMQGDGPFNMDQAKEKSRQKIGSFEDFFYQTQLPKVIEAHLKTGDLEGAERLRKFADDKKERSRTQLFGQALNDFYAGQSDGNYEPFANRAMKLLNDGGYGVRATGFEFVKDGDDKVAGITFNLKDGDREYSHTFNSMEDVAGFLAGEASPETRIKRLQEQEAAAAKFKGKMAEEEGKARIGLTKDIALEDVRHQNRLQLEAAKSKQTGSKVQQDFEFMQGLMKDSGYTDEEIKAYIPAMLKIGDYRKGRSPEEYAQQLVLEISKDPTMSRKGIAEIEARVRELIAITQRASGQSQARQPGLTGTQR